MRPSVMFSCVLSFSLSVLACSSREEAPVVASSTPDSGGRTSTTTPPEPNQPSNTAAPVDALAVVERGGELFFVLEESPEALAKVEQSCRATKDPVGCVERIREAGSHESLRISRNDAGLVLESLGHFDGREEVYAKVGFSARRGPGSQVLCAATTEVTGTRAPRPEHFRAFTIVVLDKDTIAFESGGDGSMVYRRR